MTNFTVLLSCWNCRLALVSYFIDKNFFPSFLPSLVLLLRALSLTALTRWILIRKEMMAKTAKVRAVSNSCSIWRAVWAK